MRTRCKMVVSTIGTTYDSYQHRELLKIEAYPVTQGTEEDKHFFTSSPSGKFEVSYVNADAFTGLKAGDAIYLDITLAQTREQRKAEIEAARAANR